MKTYWLKYRTLWASGHSDWKYEQLHKEKNESQLAEYIEDNIHAENGWSDKYRGCEYYQITDIPKDILERKIEDCRNRINLETERLAELKKQLNEYRSDV